MYDPSMQRLLASVRHFPEQLFVSSCRPNVLKILWQSCFVSVAIIPHVPISSVASCASQSCGISFISSFEFKKRLAFLVFSMVGVHFQPVVFAFSAHSSCSPMKLSSDSGSQTQGNSTTGAVCWGSRPPDRSKRVLRSSRKICVLFVSVGSCGNARHWKSSLSVPPFARLQTSKSHSSRRNLCVVPSGRRASPSCLSLVSRSAATLRPPFCTPLVCLVS